MGLASLDESRVNNVANRLSEIDGIYLPRHVSSSGEVSKDEKRNHLRGLMQKDAAIFLERYGKLLQYSELSLFDPLETDYEVGWHLQELKRIFRTTKEQRLQTVTVKNRRLAYLSHLIQEGSYFSEESMRLRAPLIYYDLVGQFVDPESASAARPGERYSEMLIRQSGELEFRYRLTEERRREGVLEDVSQETVLELEDDVQEFDSDDEEGISRQKQYKPEIKVEESSFHVQNSRSRNESFAEDDFGERKEDFMRLMQERFLVGDDKEYVDYGAIDNNTSLDDFWLVEVSRDAENKYFDED